MWAGLEFLAGWALLSSRQKGAIFGATAAESLFVFGAM